jgi:hypothetical protein
MHCVCLLQLLNVIKIFSFLFLQFFYPDIHQEIDWSNPTISLDKELEQITASSQTKKRYADKLFQVWSMIS